MILNNYKVYTLLAVVAILTGCGGGSGGGTDISNSSSSSSVSSSSSSLSSESSSSSNSVFSSSSESSSSSSSSALVVSDNVITNPIRENDAPLGLSSYAMGVVGKFPLDDSQVPEGIGYKSAARVVRHIATNERYTFPEQTDSQQIEETVKYFVDKGHLVTHEIHVLDGPGIRRQANPWVNKVFGHYTGPSEFRQGLMYDPKVIDAVTNLFAEAVGHAYRLEYYGAEVIICPELEDNEDHASFQQLLNILKNVGWSDRSKIVRNGGTMGEFAGLRYETHDSSIDAANSLRPGDIWNNDGRNMYLNSEPASENFSNAVSENTVRAIVELGQAKGFIVYPWEEELQGMFNNNGLQGAAAHTSAYTNRTYVFKKPVDQVSILLGIQPNQVTLAK
jgi:hypothetical protein